MSMMKLFRKILCFAVTAAVMTAAAVSVYALDDGAYTVSRETSYVNPDTGVTEDGGTNIALGDSMCASITEDKLLVEQSQGRTYMTIGLGLMSNIENVRIMIQSDDGNYYEVETTITGSCERNGDLCNHYRFEVPYAGVRISPILYVIPMGRDVQYFVTVDMSSAEPGSGNFKSEMVVETPPETEAPQETEPQTEQTYTEPAQTEAPQTTTTLPTTTTKKVTNTTVSSVSDAVTDLSSSSSETESSSLVETTTTTTTAVVTETESTESEESSSSVVLDSSSKKYGKSAAVPIAIAGGTVVIVGAAGIILWRKRRLM